MKDDGATGDSLRNFFGHTIFRLIGYSRNVSHPYSEYSTLFTQFSIAKRT